MANPVSVSTSVHAPAQGQASVSSEPTHDYVKSQKKIKHKEPTQVYNVAFFRYEPLSIIRVSNNIACLLGGYQPKSSRWYHPGIGPVSSQC
jgi:hypothetical protein